MTKVTRPAPMRSLHPAPFASMRLVLPATSSPGAVLRTLPSFDHQARSQRVRSRTVVSTASAWPPACRALRLGEPGVQRRSVRRNVTHSTTPPKPDPATLDNAFCTAPYVEVESSQDGGPTSILTIEVVDFPGLLRLIAWALNGLDVRIVRAKLSNSKDGIANDKFWITSLNGKQIAEPDNLRDRLVDILTSCIEAEREAQASSVFTAGPVTVDNSRDEGTFVTLAANPDKNSELLEVASLLSGLNFNIEASAGEIPAHPSAPLVTAGKAESAICPPPDCAGSNESQEAEICNEAMEDCPMDVAPGTWKFKISRKGKKLDHTQASSLAFALLVATKREYAMTETPL